MRNDTNEEIFSRIFIKTRDELIKQECRFDERQCIPIIIRIALIIVKCFVDFPA